MKVIFNSTL